jgi:hypothetical protein
MGIQLTRVDHINLIRHKLVPVIVQLDHRGIIILRDGKEAIINIEEEDRNPASSIYNR